MTSTVYCRLTDNIVLHSDYEFFDGPTPWTEACNESGEMICEDRNIKNIVCHISNCNTTNTEEIFAEKNNGTVQTTTIHLLDNES